MFKFLKKAKDKLRNLEYNSLLIKYTFKLKEIKKLNNNYPTTDINYFRGIYLIINSYYSHNVDRLYLNDYQKTLLFEYVIASLSGNDKFKQDIENKILNRNTKELRETLYPILTELEKDKKVKKYIRKSNIKLFSFVSSVPLLFINVAKLPIFINVFVMFPLLSILIALLTYTTISLISSLLYGIIKDSNLNKKSKEIITESSSGDFKKIKKNLKAVLTHTKFTDKKIKENLLKQIENMPEFESNIDGHNDNSLSKNSEDINDIMKKLKSNLEKIEKNLNIPNENKKDDEAELEKEIMKEIIREKA